MKEVKDKVSLENLQSMTDVNTHDGEFDAIQILSAALLTILQDNIVINRVKTAISGDSDNDEEDDDLFFNFGFNNSHYKNSKAKLAERNTDCEYVTYFTKLWKDLGKEQYGEDTCNIMLKGFCLNLDKRYEAKVKDSEYEHDENYIYETDGSTIFDLIESFNPVWNEEDYNAGLSSDSYDEKFEETLDFVIDILNREIISAESEAQRLKEIRETIDIESIKEDSILLFERFVPLKGYFSNSSDSEVKNNDGRYVLAVYPKEERINSKGEIDKENGEDTLVYYVYAIPDSKSSWGWEDKAYTNTDAKKLNAITYLDGYHFIVGAKGIAYTYLEDVDIDPYTLDKKYIGNIGIRSSCDLKGVAVNKLDTGHIMVTTVVAVGTNGSIYTKSSDISSYSADNIDKFNKMAWAANTGVYHLTNYNDIICTNPTASVATGNFKLFIAIGDNGIIEYSPNGTDWVMDRGPNKKLKQIICVNDAIYMRTDEDIYTASAPLLTKKIKDYVEAGMDPGVNRLDDSTLPLTKSFNESWTRLNLNETISCIFFDKDNIICAVAKDVNTLYKYDATTSAFTELGYPVGILDSLTINKIVYTGSKYMAICTKGYSYISDDLTSWTGLSGIAETSSIVGIDVVSPDKCNCINHEGIIYKINMQDKTDIYVSLSLAAEGLNNEYLQGFVEKKLIYSANAKQIKCKDLRSALAIAKHFVDASSFN